MFASAAGAQSNYLDEADLSKKALVIGVTSYAHLDRLPSGLEDARSFGKKLKDIGFDVTYSLDETDVEIWDRLKAFGRSLSPEDVALVYFSGHGFQYEGLNYLAPANIPKPILYDDLTLQAVPLQSVLDWMRIKGPAMSMVFLDACRDNSALVVRETGGVPKGAGIEEGKMRAPPPQLLIGYATYLGRTADSSINENENSLYTKHLNIHFTKPGADVLRILQDVSFGVLKDERNVGSTQVTETSFAAFGDFYPVPDDTVIQRAKRTWNEALATGDRAVIQDFLYRWPASKHSGAARRWMKEHSNAKVVSAIAEAQPTSGAIAWIPDEHFRVAIPLDHVRSVRGEGLAFPVINNRELQAGFTTELLAETTKPLEVFASADKDATPLGTLSEGLTVKVITRHLDGVSAWSELKISDEAGASTTVYAKNALNSGRAERSRTSLFAEFAPTSEGDLMGDRVTITSLESVYGDRSAMSHVEAFDLGKLKDTLDKLGKGPLDMSRALVSVTIAPIAPPDRSERERDQILFLKALQIRRKLRESGVSSPSISISLPATGEKPARPDQRDRLFIAIR